ncbi:hypothetical protein NBRC116493_26390 [Aurantivibrio infirmus]
MLNKKNLARLLCLPVLGLGLASLSYSTHAVETAANAETVKVAVRRLTESQYRNTIEDIFSSEIEINARFEPEKREGGLLAIGSSLLSLTSSGFEQYFTLASAVSTQVLNEENRKKFVSCEPKNAKSFDEACAKQFITHYGELLFRRPLSEGETNARLNTAATGAKQEKDFYLGLNMALTSLLVAPEFIFRVEMAEPDPNNAEELRLDGYTKAARMSFLFWDTTPDKELLEAAKSGALHTEAGLNKQLDRLASSPNFKDGANAFLADVLQLDGFANLVKDPAIYPKFNQTVSDSAREQMLKTAINLLIEERGDYRDLFTSNKTFINRSLASIYNVPFASAEEWTEYEFSDSSGRAGILTQVGFLSLFAHPGTSSPTRRGIKIHEIFMCEPTPDPPADVDFSKVKDSMSGTVRGRLLDHMENTGCTACHQRSDPPGLALEHFDGLGQLRKYENGTLIDVSADLNGVKLVGAKGLGEFLHEDPRIPACLVRNVYAYGVGRETDFWDEDYLADQTDAFAENGYRVPDLMKQIVSTPEFFKVVVPEGQETASAAESVSIAAQQ